MLGLVTCYFNPCGYRRLEQNYWRFRAALQRSITTIELSFNGEFAIPDAIHVVGNERHVLWQKERLLNLAISHLEAHYDKLAWVDADLLFLNPSWEKQAEEMLKRFAVAQLCQAFLHTDQTGNVIERKPTFAYGHTHGTTTGVSYNHGGGWALRREVWEAGGLYDRDILGGNDTAALHAWTGQPERYASRWNGMQGMQQDYAEWASPQSRLVAGKIGYLPGEAIHLWHGEKANRHYWNRNKILQQHRFDPTQDMRLGTNQVWEWTNRKPTLERAVADYFRGRQEDG